MLKVYHGTYDSWEEIYDATDEKDAYRAVEKYIISYNIPHAPYRRMWKDNYNGTLIDYGSYTNFFRIKEIRE